MAARQPAGFVLRDGLTVADTERCVHCGAHWVRMPGSGRLRGWCTRCHGSVCGPRCAVCVPFEQRLDQAERQGHR
jgi:hypothetical protein